MNKNKVGLVLEGGAMRGMFTAGVLDVWMEAGVAPDGVIGVSAGAAFGCNLKSGQIGRAVRYNKRFCGDKRYCSVRSWLTTGDLYNVDFCYRRVPLELDVFDAAAFDRSPMEFYVVCTDVQTGKPVYHRIDKVSDRCLDWIRASASMPLASRVVQIGPHKLLDGGIADSIPLRYFESIGYTRNIVILTQPEGFVKTRNKLLPVMRVALHRYPKMLDALAHRHELYNQTTEYIRRQLAAGRVFVVRPTAPLNIGAMTRDPAELERVYQLGRAAGQQSLAGVQAFMAQTTV